MTKNNLNSRLDTRSIEEFKENLESNQNEEYIAIKLYCINEGITVKHIIPSGAESFKVENYYEAIPDFKIKDKYLEVKVHSEKYPKISLKESNVKHYMSLKSDILIFRESYGIFIPYSTLNNIINFHLYTDDSVFGGKPHYKIMSHHLEIFYEEEKFYRIEWNKKVKEEIDKLSLQGKLFKWIKTLGVPNLCFSLTEKDDSREKVFSKQRIKRGFDDSETWSLSDTIINFSLPRLKRYRKIIEKAIADNAIADNKHKKRVNKTIIAFELLSRNNGERIFTDKELKKVNKGLKAFNKEFLNLWW